MGSGDDAEGGEKRGCRAFCVSGRTVCSNVAFERYTPPPPSPLVYIRQVTSVFYSPAGYDSF